MIYNNNVKPVLDRFNKEVKEFKQKSTVNYIKSKVISSINKKVTQAKKIYHSIEKSYNDFKRSNAPIRTTLHKHLDSIVKNKKYQTFRNSHFIKQVVDAMSWGARVLGLW